MRTSTKVGAGIAAAVLVFLGLFAANDPESFKGAFRLPIGPLRVNTLTASVNHDVAGAKVTQGTNAVRIGSWRLRVFGENVDLTGLTFSTKAAGAAYMTNLTAKLNGAQFGSVAAMFGTLTPTGNSAYTGKHGFTLPANAPLRLNQGTATVDLYAAIGTGYQPTPELFSFEFSANGKSVPPAPNLANPQPIKPVKYFMSNVSRGQTTEVHEHGEIVVIRASDSPSGNIVPGNDMTLAKWSLYPAYEEVEVRGFCFTIINAPNQTVAGPAANGSLTGSVEFVLGNGQVVYSMAAAHLQMENCVDLSSYFVLQKDVPEMLRMKANISDSARGSLVARLWGVKGVGQNSATLFESSGDAYGNTLNLPLQAPIAPTALAVTNVSAAPSLFNPSDGQITSLNFTLNLDATATLVIKRASDSAIIRTLLSNQFFTADQHNYIWSGRDNNSAIVPSGLYIFEVTATTQQFGGQTSTGSTTVTVGNSATSNGTTTLPVLHVYRASDTPPTVVPGDAIPLAVWGFQATGMEDIEVRKLCFDVGNNVSASDFSNFRIDEHISGAATAGVAYSTGPLAEHTDGNCASQQYALSTYFIVPRMTSKMVTLRANILPSALGKDIAPQVGNVHFYGMTSTRTANYQGVVYGPTLRVGN